MTAPTGVLLLVRSLGAGGTERQTAEIARTLDPERFTVHVGAVETEGWRADELRAHGIPVLPIPLRTLIGKDPFASTALLGRYCREHSIRLLHAFDPPMTVFGVPAGRWLGLPVVLASQRTHRDILAPRQQHLLRISDRLAHGLVANCEAMRSYVVERYGWERRRVHVCPNGIDADAYPYRERSTGEGPLTIGTVCVLRPEKGLATLLEGFSRLPQRRSLRLRIIGDGPERPHLEELARRRGIECEFQPAARDVAAALDSLDIFVLPSLSEALSNSLMEAMAAGCFPIASRVGGNPELITPDETGLLFEPGDGAGLATQLLRAIDNPSSRIAQARAAAEKIRHQFTREAAADRMASIYEHFLTR